MSDEMVNDDSGARSPSVQDTRRLADEAAKDLQNVLERAGVSDDLLRNVVQKVQQRGRGGRTPAGDPRLDPNIEPKKAKRILANRLSAAKSKMRQRVLSESLEILKAKENSRNGSVEPSDGTAPGHNTAAADDVRQVKRMCLDLQARNKELEARVRVLEAQMAIAAASSIHNPVAGSTMRVLHTPTAYQGDAGAGAALLAALSAGGPSGNNPSSRPPLVTSSLAPSALSLLNFGPGSSLMHSSLQRGLQMLDGGRMDAGAATGGWVMDCNTGLGQLMMPSVAMFQGQGQHNPHQGLQIMQADTQGNSKDASRMRK